MLHKVHLRSSSSSKGEEFCVNNFWHVMWDIDFSFISSLVSQLQSYSLRIWVLLLAPSAFGGIHLTLWKLYASIWFHIDQVLL